MSWEGWLPPTYVVLVLACGDAPRRAEPHDTLRAPQAEVVDTPPQKPGALVLEIEGIALAEVKGWYRYGVLSLYTGGDPYNDFGQVVRFWSMPDAPNGQILRSPDDPNLRRGRHMTYEKHNPSVSLGSEGLEEGSHYEITLGKEEGYAVPVTINAAADKPVRLRVRGTIAAMTRGIKLIGGAVDRSFDHLDTIEYLTRAWIEKQYGATELSAVADYCMMTNAPRDPTRSNTPQVAACSFLFRGAKGALGVGKLWLEKRDGSWLEVGAVKPDQLLRAHPIHPARPEPPDLFEPMALERFERDVYRAAGGFRRITEPALFSCGGGQREGEMGWCEIPYDVAPKDRDLRDVTGPQFDTCQRASYLFERDAAGGFHITRTLGTSERFDRASQRVVPRELPMQCRPQAK